MLNIRRVTHLAAVLQTSVDRLHEVADEPQKFCEELVLLDPAKPDKRRKVLDVRGDLRRFQDRILRTLLLPRITPSPFSHGSIKGRHIKSNVLPHVDSIHVLTADISNFYPTISHNRVYRLFVAKMGCTPDVARLCTKLCTYRYHLALGLVTSPALADQILTDVDRRIGVACEKANLIYTRYVDDLTISGAYDLQESGFSALLQRIVAQHGFTINPDKNHAGRLDEGEPITKLTIRRGHPDVRREYLAELERQLDDANNLASGREFQGPYYLRNQLAGRVQFVGWINASRKKKLLAKLNAIPWRKVKAEAAKRDLFVARKRLVKASEFAPELMNRSKSEVCADA